MNQKKIGAFLKQLRNEKNLTQEELSEKFYVSTKTISRWETGSNLPDLSMLLDLAEFYQVDITELIDGERKPDSVTADSKDSFKKMAQYSEEEKKAELRYGLKIMVLVVIGCGLLVLPTILFVGESTNVGLLYYIIPYNIRCILVWLTYIPATILLPYGTGELVKSTVTTNDAKKLKIFDIIYKVVFLFGLLLIVLFDTEYGPLYSISSPDFANTIRTIGKMLICILVFFMSIPIIKSMLQTLKSYDNDSSEKK